MKNVSQNSKGVWGDGICLQPLECGSPIDANSECFDSLRKETFAQRTERKDKGTSAPDPAVGTTRERLLAIGIDVPQIENLSRQLLIEDEMNDFLNTSGDAARQDCIARIKRRITSLHRHASQVAQVVHLGYGLEKMEELEDLLVLQAQHQAVRCAPGERVGYDVAGGEIRRSQRRTAAFLNGYVPLMNQDDQSKGGLSRLPVKAGEEASGSKSLAGMPKAELEKFLDEENGRQWKLCRELLKTLEKFFVNERGETPTYVERQAVVEELRQADGKNLNVLIGDLEVANFMALLHSKYPIADPRITAAALQHLLKRAEEGKNAAAARTLDHLGTSDQVHDRIAALLSSNERVANQSLVAIRSLLPDDPEVLADIRTRAVSGLMLPEKYGPADLDNLVDKLKTLPVGLAGQDMSEWAFVEKQMKLLSSSLSQGKDGFKDALSELVKLAGGGNRYAVDAISELLVPGRYSLLLRQAEGSFDGGTNRVKKQFSQVDAFCELSKSGLDASLVRELCQLPDDKLSRANLTALALCAGLQEKSNVITEMVSMKISKIAGERIVDCSQALVTAIRIQPADKANALSSMYVNTATKGDSGKRNFVTELASMRKWAQDDDRASLRSLELLASGALSDYSERSEGDIYHDTTEKKLQRDARQYCRELSPVPAMRAQIRTCLREVCEPQLAQHESRYDPYNSAQSGRLASLHRFLGDQYKDCGMADAAQEHDYEAQEIERVNKLIKSIDKKGDAAVQAFDFFARLPEKVKAEFGANGIGLSCESASLDKVIEQIPGVRLGFTERQLLSGMQSISLSFDSVKLTGESVLAVTVPLGSINVRFKDVSASVHVDEKEEKIVLDNIKGVTTGLDVPAPTFRNPGRTRRVEQDVLQSIEIRITTSVEGVPQLKIEPRSTLAPGLQPVIVPLTPDGAQSFKKAVTEFRAGKDMRQLLYSVLPGGDATPLAALLGSLKSFEKVGDKLTAALQTPLEPDFGFGKVSLDQTVSARIERSGDTFSLGQIEGVAVKVVDRVIGEALKITERIGIKQADLGKRQSDGSRTLKVKTDSALEEIGVELSPSMGLHEREGMVSASARLRVEKELLDWQVSIGTKDIGRSIDEIGNLEVQIDGPLSARRRLLERIKPESLPDSVVDACADVKKVGVYGKVLVLEREGTDRAEIELNGVTLSVAPRLRVERTDKSGSGMLKVDGLSFVKLPVVDSDFVSSNYLNEQYGDRLPAEIESIKLGQSSHGFTVDCKVKDVFKCLFLELDEHLGICGGYGNMENPVEGLRGANRGRSKADAWFKINKDGSLSYNAPWIVIEGVAQTIWNLFP